VRFFKVLQVEIKRRRENHGESITIGLILRFSCYRNANYKSLPRHQERECLDVTFVVFFQFFFNDGEANSRTKFTHAVQTLK
jgi:hypothetical protein